MKTWLVIAGLAVVSACAGQHRAQQESSAKGIQFKQGASFCARLAHVGTQVSRVRDSGLPGEDAQAVVHELLDGEPRLQNLLPDVIDDVYGYPRLHADIHRRYLLLSCQRAQTGLESQPLSTIEPTLVDCQRRPVIDEVAACTKQAVIGFK